MERVTIKHADLMSVECELVALPCSTGGTAHDWVHKIARAYGLPPPPASMDPGTLSPVHGSLDRAFVYAASVHYDESDADVIEWLGRALGDLTNYFGFRVIGTPLLGAGLGRARKPRIEPTESLDALRRGFLLTAHTAARLVVVVPEAERVVTLTQDQKAFDASAARGFDIPPVLIDRIARGQAVLFAGGGFAIQSGYPTWPEFLERLLQNGGPDGVREPDERRLLNLVRADPDLVAELLIARRSREWVIAELARAYAAAPSYKELHHLAANLPFAGIIDACWSKSLETLLGGKSVVVEPSPASAGAIPQLLSQLAPFIVKLWGSPERPETVSLTHEDYRQQFRRNELYGRFLAHLATTQSIVFMLTSLGRVEAFFGELPLWDVRQGTHFAYLTNKPSEQALARAEVLRARYGVHSIFYTPAADYPEAAEMLRAIESRLGKRRHARQPMEVARLDSVHLTNIGPFENLDLFFDPFWNVLIGNNGCGKSTILRAIALGLCGADPKVHDAAAGLLRVGTSSGSIEIRAGKRVFRTTLVREGGLVRVQSAALTPLQTGRAVVLGFPALRGKTAQNPTGPTGGGSSNPEVSDLLPLLRGAVDHRIDGTKQWIVNTQLRAEPTSQTTRKVASRFARQRDAYFRILSAMTPGVEIRFDHVEPGTWRVMVKSADGVVPIDALSQGTNSILGWVGTLLQRMYEIHSDAEHPELEPALVLVDEIDAHMHPEWQRELVPMLRKHFPKLQLIATTHSPLIVGSLDANEFRFVHRDADGKSVVAERSRDSLKGWRTDQILTSPLFNLETTLSSEITRSLDEFRALNAKSHRSESEEARLAEVRATLGDRIPASPETQADRDAIAAVSKYLDGAFADQPRHRKLKTLAAAEQLLARLEKKR